MDTEKFRYFPSVRAQYRQKFSVENKLVVGHIGRFEIQKNHKFLIEIFQQIHRKEPQSVLFLIGAGDLRAECEKQVQELGIQDSVFFLGIRRDIPELLNMMDLFLMPSFFEGLPVVGVEAQATGLPVYMSDEIAKELPIEDLSEYLSLNESAEQWADIILEKQKDFVRRDTAMEIAEQGYEIKKAAKQFEKYYLEMNQKN
ncbi:MAG: glycosyltransferase [Lacrimispora saccharolytica]